MSVAADLAHAANRAAPAPWHLIHADAVGYMNGTFVSTVDSDEFPGANNVVAATWLAPDWATNDKEEENSAFIVAARSDVPVLCDLVVRLSQDRALLREALAAVVNAIASSSDDASLPEYCLALARRALAESTLLCVTTF